MMERLIAVCASLSASIALSFPSLAQPAPEAVGDWFQADLVGVSATSPTCVIGHVVERRMLLNLNQNNPGGMVGRYFRSDFQLFFVKGGEDCKLSDAPNEALDVRLLCWALDGVQEDRKLVFHAIYDPRTSDDCAVPPDTSRNFDIQLTPSGSYIFDDGDPGIGGALTYERKSARDNAVDEVQSKISDLFLPLDSGECELFVRNSLTDDAIKRFGKSTAEFCFLRTSIHRLELPIERQEFPISWHITRLFTGGGAQTSDLVLLSGSVYFQGGTAASRTAILKKNAAGDWKIDFFW